MSCHMHLMAQGALESHLIHVHSHTDLSFTVLFHFSFLLHLEQHTELDNLITMQNLRISANKGSNDAYDVHTSLTFYVKGIYPAPHIHEHLRYTIMATALRTPSRITSSCLSTLRLMTRTPQSTRTPTMRSSEHAAHRPLMHSVHIAPWLKSRLVCHPCHPCMRTCGWCLELSVFFLVSFVFYFLSLFLFQLYLMSTSAPNERSMSNPLCDSSLGSVVTSDYVTPLTGYEPKKDLNLTDAEELDLTTSSDIYFQNALDDIASFPNDPDVDDNELAEFLAVVVDRTGKPVEVRSNNDQFSCDIRNLKSAQSQFPLVTQPKRMISQTGGLFKPESLRSVKALTHRLGQC